MLKKIQAFQKLAKTVAAPFTQLRNIRAANKRDVAKTITSVPPNVPKTKKDIALSKLAIQRQKTKGSGAKLKQTLFEKDNPEFKGKDFTFSPRVGRSSKVRKNLKRGTGLIPKKKSNVDKIKKSFGTLSVRAGIDNNPNITYADKIAGAKMKNKKTKKKVI
jgi:hypothetical protein